MKTTQLFAITEIPLVQQDDDLGKMIFEVASKEKFTFEDNDVVVIASKIVSKAEGRLIDIDTVEPSPEAISLAEKLNAEPRSMELVLRETKRFLRLNPDVILTEHRLGFVCTKAGVDSSNTAPGPKGKIVALLPENPDLSAQKIRETIQHLSKKKIAVIINDTFGRPYRNGSVGMAIGISGIAALYTEGGEDLFGRSRHPSVSQVDEIAAAASLAMGQTTRKLPVIILRGIDYAVSEKDTISDVLRSYKEEILEIAKQIKK